MLTIDESDFTPDHIEFLHQWADNPGTSVEVLLARIVLATSEGDEYVEMAHGKQKLESPSQIN